jgi:hypothetical protein
MLLQPIAKQDFDFRGRIKVDTDNTGFTPDEIGKIADAAPITPGQKGEKGKEGDWWTHVWLKNRKVPPEIENLKSEFGYQSHPLLTDLITVADAQGTRLEGIIKARSANYNFYLMRCGVYILPGGGEKFEALKYEVRYKDDRVSTYDMLPGPMTQKRLVLGGNADIGVNGKAEFGFPEIPIGGTAVVGGSAKADVEAKFIVSFQYELKTQIVESFGKGTEFCSWFMHKGENLRNDVLFYPVIMTPKPVNAFECEFRAYFKISHPEWKNAEFFLKPPRTIPVNP